MSVGAIPQLWLPEPWKLVDSPTAGAALSDTGFLALEITGPPELIDVAWDPREGPVWLADGGLGVVTRGKSEQVVRFGGWRPTRIAGFWANTAILAADDQPQLAFALTGTDPISDLPLPPELTRALPGNSLLRVVEPPDEEEAKP